MSTVHEIGRYELSHFYLPPAHVLSPVARLRLYAPDERTIGTVDFVRPRDGLIVAASAYDEISQEIQAVMHHDQLQGVVDTLRNERPCFIRWTHYASADLWAVSIDTTPEPVGEEETSPRRPHFPEHPVVVAMAGRPAGGGEYRCSFCGRERADVEKLIAGQHGAICGDCVATSQSVIDGQP